MGCGPVWCRRGYVIGLKLSGLLADPIRQIARAQPRIITGLHWPPRAVSGSPPKKRSEEFPSGKRPSDTARPMMEAVEGDASAALLDY